MQMKGGGGSGNLSRGGDDVWRQMFCASLDAILLTCPDGSILAANAEACRIFGMSEEEIRRAGSDGLIDPADSRFIPLREERARMGKVRGELRMRRGDGSLFPATVASAVFMDSSGSELICVIVRDLTEQRRLEEELRQNESRYR
ncbi:MAG TPA: PAS domain S-box protein, partial [Geobacteraceae bacterium]